MTSDVTTINSMRDFFDLYLDVKKDSGMTIFRGIDKVYDLVPSLGRYIDGLRKEGVNEGALYEYSRKLEIFSVLNYKSEGIRYLDKNKIGTSQNRILNINLILTAQHYGLPTRLLDWTKNPLVALYFCAKSSVDEDGVLYHLRPPWVFTENTLPVLEKAFKAQTGDDIFEEFIIPYHPDVFDDMVAAQSAVFTIHPRPFDKLDMNDLIPEFEETIEDNESVFSALDFSPDVALDKYIISASMKKEALTVLRIMGISEQTLFPGLDGIAKTMINGIEEHIQLNKNSLLQNG